MQYMGNIDAEAGGMQLSHAVAGSDRSGEARQALLILDGIDIQHGRELTALDQSGAEEELKEYIRSDIIARYHARRAPFVRFLEERQQPETPLAT